MATDSTRNVSVEHSLPILIDLLDGERGRFGRGGATRTTSTTSIHRWCGSPRPTALRAALVDPRSRWRQNASRPRERAAASVVDAPDFNSAMASHFERWPRRLARPRRDVRSWARTPLQPTFRIRERFSLLVRTERVSTTRVFYRRDRNPRDVSRSLTRFQPFAGAPRSPARAPASHRFSTRSCGDPIQGSALERLAARGGREWDQVRQWVPHDLGPHGRERVGATVADRRAQVAAGCDGARRPRSPCTAPPAPGPSAGVSKGLLGCAPS